MNPQSLFPAASRRETNDVSGRGPGPRPPRSRGTRVAVVITAAAGLALLAACSSSPSSTDPGSPAAGGSATSSTALAWVQCVRSHGVPDFPGLTSSGYIPKIASGQQVGVSDSQFNAAQTACQNLWPYQAPTQAQQQRELTDDLKFAQCMRSRGLPDFPDPIVSDGRVEFVLSVRDGLDPRSPQILAKAHECQYVLPAGTGLPSATVAP